MDDEHEGGADARPFSQRYGYTPYREAIQIESLDERTRTDLWNLIIYPRFLNVAYPYLTGELIWIGHFRLQRDQYTPNAVAFQLKRLILEGEWFSVYDLIEFLIRHSRYDKRDDLVDSVNQVLAGNRAGYRVVDGLVVPITTSAEADAVEKAANSPIANARPHIRRSIALLADRDNPNFPKAIQEAILAAEAAANFLAGKQTGTLADALKAIQRNNPALLHPALIEGWKQIYGFTGDSGGIRHALKDGTIDP